MARELFIHEIFPINWTLSPQVLACNSNPCLQSNSVQKISFFAIKITRSGIDTKQTIYNILQAILSLTKMEIL